MKKENKHVNPWVKIFISVALIAVFMTRKYFLPPLTAPVKNCLSILGFLVAAVGICVIFKSISEILTNKKPKETNFVMPSEPVKVWSHEELFDYLEKEEMVIDLLIDCTNSEEFLLVGVSSDYDRRRDKWIDKIYFINELEYRDFDEFKENFIKIHPENVVRIMRASIGNGQIIIDL